MMIRIMLLGVLWHGGSAWAQEPNATVGEVEQVEIPELKERLERARARRSAIEAFTSGEGSFDRAFPDLVGMAWNDDEVLRGRLLRLDDGVISRQQEARGSQSADLPEKVATRFNTLQDEVLVEERAASQLERQALLALRGLLQRYPRWQRESLQTQQALRFGERDTEGGDLAEVTEAARADVSRARWVQLGREIRDQAISEEMPAPDLGPELRELSEGKADQWSFQAAIRIYMALPFLQEDPAEEARRILSAWVEGPCAEAQAQEAAAAQEWADAKIPEDADEEEIERLLTEQKEVVRQLSRVIKKGLPGEQSTNDLRVAFLEGQHDVETARLEALRGEGEQAARFRLESAAQEAADAAELARQSVDDHPAAAVRAASLSWMADALELIEAYDVKTAEDASALEEKLKGYKSTVAEAKKARDIPAIDEVYRKLRGVMDGLRGRVSGVVGSLQEQVSEVDREGELKQDLLRLDTWKGEVSQIADPERRNEVNELLAETETALTNELQVAAKARAAEERRIRSTILGLRQTKEFRHDVSSSVSASARRDDRTNLLPDAMVESRLLRRQVRSIAYETERDLGELPRRLLDVDFLNQVIKGLFLTGIMIVGWFVLRKRRSKLATKLLDRYAPGRVTDVKGRQAFDAQVGLILARLIDAAFIWLLRSTVYGFSVVAGVLWDTVLAGALWLAMLRTLQLLFTQGKDQRPALFTVSPSAMKIGRNSLIALTVWYLTDVLIRRGLQEMVYADALAEVVHSVLRYLLLAIVVVILYRWQPMLRERMDRFQPLPGWLETWMTRADVGILAPVNTIVFGSYLLAAAVWDLIQDQFASRESMGALVSVADRMRFGGRSRVESAPDAFPAELWSEFAARPLVDDPEVRDPAAEILRKQFEEWRKDPRRGTVVVTSDRGEDVTGFLASLKPHLVIDDRDPEEVEVTKRLVDKKDAIAWFIDRFSLPLPPDTRSLDAVAQAMIEKPPEVHLVRSGERSFLRAVRGFEALRAMLYVFNASSSQHFWIIEMHRPAWGYLARLGDLVNLGVVRHVVDLRPMSGRQVRELILGRMERLGLSVDFGRLENTGPFGAPKEIEQERAISSYFRLLAEVTHGSPALALALWAVSLVPIGDNRFEVVLVPQMNVSHVEKLDRDGLFVLMALRIHDRLHAKNLARVVNRSLMDVRGTVRELEQRGIVHVDGAHVTIALRQLRVVTRTLRRRHVLQWEM